MGSLRELSEREAGDMSQPRQHNYGPPPHHEGFQPPSGGHGGGYSHPPAPQQGYSQSSAPQQGYSQSPAPQQGYSQSSAPQQGYSQSPAPQQGYSQSPAGQYQPAPQQHYSQAPTGQYDSAPQQSYSQPPASQYQSAPQHGHSQSQSGRYESGPQQTYSQPRTQSYDSAPRYEERPSQYQGQAGAPPQGYDNYGPRSGQQPSRTSPIDRRDSPQTRTGTAQSAPQGYAGPPQTSPQSYAAPAQGAPQGYASPPQGYSNAPQGYGDAPSRQSTSHGSYSQQAPSHQSYDSRAPPQGYDSRYEQQRGDFPAQGYQQQRSSTQASAGGRDDYQGGYSAGVQGPPSTVAPSDSYTQGGRQHAQGYDDRSSSRSSYSAEPRQGYDHRSQGPPGGGYAYDQRTAPAQYQASQQQQYYDAPPRPPSQATSVAASLAPTISTITPSMARSMADTRSTAAPSPAMTVRDLQVGPGGFNVDAPSFYPGGPQTSQASYAPSLAPSDAPLVSIDSPHLAPPPPPSAQGTSSSGTRTATTRREITPATSAGDSNAPNLADKLEALRLTSFYVRPGFGAKGRKIPVLSNYFAVRAMGGRGKIIYHYDIDINPVVKSTNMKRPRQLLRAVWEQLALEQTDPQWQRGFKAVAFDGRKNAFTPYKFPIADGETYVHTVTLLASGEIQRSGQKESSSDEEQRRYRVTMKLVADIDLETVMEFCRADKNAPKSEELCLTAVMATNVLLRDFPSKTYTQVGATGNKFYTMDNSRPLPQGAMVCKGFLQSFRYASAGMPLINIDLGFSAFLQPGPAVEVVNKILSFGPVGARGGGPQNRELDQLDQRQIAILKKKLRGAKFTVTHRNSARLHTVVTVTLHSANELNFVLEGKDGNPDRRVSVAQFYKEYYSCEVTKPRLPCIQYGKRSYIPLEFAVFAEFNSLPPTNLTAEQTAEMIKVSAMKPRDRLDMIMHWRRELAYQSQEKVAEWGLQVNNNMVELEGRILDPPKVTYRNDRPAQVFEGGWKLRGMQFTRDGIRPLNNWAVVSFDRYCDTGDMQRWVSYLCSHLNRLGVEVKNNKPPIISPSDPRQHSNLVNSISEAARKAFMVSGETPQLIIVILPGKDAWLYETIKKISFTELKAPVPTQCMQAAKIKSPRGVEAYTDNLAMKIVAKLGGLSHRIPAESLPGLEKGKTMILGADLGHPPFAPGSTVPTVACSIATYNAECDAYSAQIRLQIGRSEIINDLSTMVEAHLKIFAKNNDGSYPERILVFRDGISEGQYAAALQYEHDAIVSACRRIEGTYRPRILVCVCAKRHNTRFFAKDQRAHTDRTGNLPSGLCVDRSITHPYAFDFFLQSHAGLVGTARPTHYICLLDELAMTPDDLQKLVHGLCFSFARCTRSVSVVPVCYMADLVCQKARLIVQRADDSVTPSETSGSRRGAPTATTTTSTVLRTQRGDFDLLHIQNMLSRNPEISEVAWWM